MSTASSKFNQITRHITSGNTEAVVELLQSLQPPVLPNQCWFSSNILSNEEMVTSLFDHGLVDLKYLDAHINLLPVQVLLLAKMTNIENN